MCNELKVDIYLATDSRFLIYMNGQVGRGFEPRSGQNKDYKIGMSCFKEK